MIRIFLCGKLRHRICRETIPNDLFLLRHRLIIAIDRRTRCIGKLLDAVFRSSLHHIDRADNIRQRIVHRLLNTLRDAHRCCLVQDIIRTFTHMVTERCIPNITLDKLKIRVIPKSRDILRIPRRQIIQHMNPMPHRQNRLAQIRADKPRSACDKEQAVFWKYNRTIVHDISLLSMPTSSKHDSTVLLSLYCNPSRQR